MKKIICATLAALMLLSLVACVSPVDQPSDGTTTAASNDDDTTPIVTTVVDDNKMKPDLPDEKYTDYKFVIANTGYDNSKYTFSHMVSDTPTGDIIDNATYSRTILLEELFDIELMEEKMTVTTLTAALQSRDDIYAIGMVDLSNIMKFVNEGYCIDLMNVETIDLNMPWWDQNAKEKLSFCGKLFYTFSDATIFGLDNARAVYFNKSIYETLELNESLYDLVEPGNWTVTKLFQTAEKAIDKGGDGVWSADDQYGISGNGTTVYEALLTGCEAEIVQINDSGDPFFYPFDENTAQRFVDVYDKLIALAKNNESYQVKATEESRSTFSNGKQLFLIDTLLMASKLRQLDLDFGILPTPKYNAAQENYYNVSPNGHAIFICDTNANVDRVGVILEAMSYYSSSHYDNSALIPQYFDLALKSKSSKDVESMDSLQRIHDSVSYVIKIVGTEFSSLTFDQFTASTTSTKRNITNLVDREKDKNNKLLSDTLAKFRN